MLSPPYCLLIANRHLPCYHESWPSRLLLMHLLRRHEPREQLIINKQDSKGRALPMDAGVKGNTVQVSTRHC